jgi:PAS domain S-box-containing protein
MLGHEDGLEMDAAEKSRDELLIEVSALRRQIAALETVAVEQRRTEQRLLKEAMVSSAALRQSEATAQAVLESASEGILLINADGRITLVNGAAERMFGYAHDELLGRTLEVLLPDRIREVHRAHRADYFAAPRVRPMGSGLDLAGRRKDGTEFPVEISLSYVQTQEGMTAMALITDNTERKRAEAELSQQREALYQTEKLAALGTLTAGIAHEMNNPLGIIASRIELMLLDAEEQNLPARILDDLRVLHRATQRVARIATNLRSFARQTPREHTTIDLNAVVQETLLLMQKPLEVDHIRLVTSLDQALPPIVGDASTLQQVLLNLVTNAREAMASGGEIRIETGPDAGRPGWVRLGIADTGPGISAEELSKIFDPFYTTKRSGTGLGLSVSYGIVRDHQGTIDVQSIPGRGTTFVLVFPAASNDRG